MVMDPSSPPQPADKELLDVDVEGGAMRVARWAATRASPKPIAVVAAHGTTASHAGWTVVAARLRDEVTVIAPDLRGRGGSNRLPGPYGMAVTRALGVERAVVVGHSMGGWVATTAAVTDPHRIRGLVLVDGGLPFGALAPDMDPEKVIELLLGPALRRLRMTFDSREAYRDFWRSHPAFEGRWSPAVQAYVDYDLEDESGVLRSKVVECAVRADNRDLLTNVVVRTAVERVRCPVVFLRAPRGLRNEPHGLYPPADVQAAAGRIPGLRTWDVAGANHYTVLLAASHAAYVAEHVRTMVHKVS
jgi:pimeloyl-ACP methyl ester carboxylesterase